MTTNSKNERELTKKDLRQVFTRSCTLDSAWNYERQQHINFCYMMIPVLKRLYKDDSAAMSRALKRHLEFMACTPHIVTLLAGVCASMEEENAANSDFDESTISAVKVSLMGPMAAVGDSFFWGTLLTIAIGVGVSFSSSGNIMGPILFLLIINVPAFLARFYGLRIGLNNGMKFFADASNSDTIARITKVASILGLMVVGAMVATTVSFSITYEVGVEGAMTPIQTYIDQIMPCLLPAVAFFVMYYLLGKKIKTTTILIFLIIFSCVGCYLGIF